MAGIQKQNKQTKKKHELFMFLKVNSFKYHYYCNCFSASAVESLHCTLKLGALSRSSLLKQATTKKTVVGESKYLNFLPAIIYSFQKRWGQLLHRLQNRVFCLNNVSYTMAAMPTREKGLLFIQSNI